MKLGDTKPEDWPVMTTRYRKDCTCPGAEIWLDKTGGWVWRCEECDARLVPVTEGRDE